MLDLHLNVYIYSLKYFFSSHITQYWRSIFSTFSDYRADGTGRRSSNDTGPTWPRSHNITNPSNLKSFTNPRPDKEIKYQNRIPSQPLDNRPVLKYSTFHHSSPTTAKQTPSPAHKPPVRLGTPFGCLGNIQVTHMAVANHWAGLVEVAAITLVCQATAIIITIILVKVLIRIHQVPSTSPTVGLGCPPRVIPQGSESPYYHNLTETQTHWDTLMVEPPRQVAM